MKLNHFFIEFGVMEIDFFIFLLFHFPFYASLNNNVDSINYKLFKFLKKHDSTS